METLIQDIRVGSRMLRKAPAFTIVAVVVLALGIGANTAIFSVVNAVLLKPLPFPESDRLMQVWHVPPPKSFHGMTRFSVSPANYLDWVNQNRVFEQMAIYGFWATTLTGRGQPEAISGIGVSNDFFSVLKVQPLLGRTFLPEENDAGRGHVAVLSQGFWQTHFGSDPGILGQTILLNHESYVVVGIIASKFAFPPSTNPKSQPQLWTPLAWTDKDRAVRGNHNYHVIGRLRPGTDLTQAQAEMSTISRRLEQTYPEDDKGWGAVVVPMRDQLVGDARPALLVLLGAVGFVLLIACANVANLVLVRTLARQKEIAIRAALGASSLRVLRQILSETILLSLTGGIVGLLFAHFAVRLIIAFLSQSLPRVVDVTVDAWVLSFTLGISLFTGIVAGLVPALRASKANLNDSLKQGLGRTDADSTGNRTRGVLVVSEIALSLVLLIGAGLMIRSLSRLRNVDPGLDSHNVVTMSLALPGTKYSNPQQQIAFFDQLLARMRALPGVESVGAIDSLPLEEGGSSQPVAIEGQPLLAMSEQPEVAVRVVEPGYFQTMRIPVVQGRPLSPADNIDRPSVIVVSQSTAQRFWPGENPLGKRLKMSFFPEKSREVVGVVGDVKQDGLDVVEPVATLYLPQAQYTVPYLSLVVRTTSQPTALSSALTAAVHELDREQPVRDVVTMDDILADSVSHQRFHMLMLAGFSGLALLLAAIGIYSVLSYSVRRRVREIGVRMALGAQRGDILRMILGQGTKLALIGAGIGVAGALALTRLMSSQLFGVTATDPITFVSVSALILLVALLACYIPAQRATKVDPMVALRYE
jgi:putative ABC transport system permease protein